jgi:hypothetical protein
VSKKSRMDTRREVFLIHTIFLGSSRERCVYTRPFRCPSMLAIILLLGEISIDWSSRCRLNKYQGTKEDNDGISGNISKHKFKYYYSSTFVTHPSSNTNYIWQSRSSMRSRCPNKLGLFPDRQVIPFSKSSRNCLLSTFRACSKLAE